MSRKKVRPLAAAPSVPSVPVDPAAGSADEKSGNMPEDYDDEATRMARQAIVDHIGTLSPSARAATELYFRGILPRLVVMRA